MQTLWVARGAGTDNKFFILRIVVCYGLGLTGGEILSSSWARRAAKLWRDCGRGVGFLVCVRDS